MTDLVLARDSKLREADWRDDQGRRNCIDCGGWQLRKGRTSLFVPILVAENEYGWICEVCLLLRLKRRARIVTTTSPAAYSMDVAEREIDRRLDEISRKRNVAERKAPK